jgi:glucosylceramidase
VTVVQTSRDLSERLTRLPPLRFATAPPRRGLPVIVVSDATRYQRVTGVGAALTDSAAWLLETQLSSRARTEAVEHLFGSSGIALQIVRVPIAASDFTRTGRPYSYDDGAHPDPVLAHFSVAHDDAYIVPLLHRAIALNRSLEILAAPWSPPPWMKTNHAFNNIGDRGRLKASVYAALARYFVAFIEAYARRGVPVGAISAQNEPGQPTRYPGLAISTAEQERFIGSYLAPALVAAGLRPKLYLHDSFWSTWRRARALSGDATLRREAAGVAWHCYVGDPTAMTALHVGTPRLDQIVSECSTGLAPGPTSELLIAAFRNWASAVVLWNAALNRHGGPVQPPNAGCPRCSGVLTVDERTHTINYTADYYQLGQLSRFVSRGATRIASSHFVKYNATFLNQGPDYATAGVDDVAFENPDGTKVLLAHNTGARRYRFAVRWRGRTFTYTLAAGATVTFEWR